MVKHAIQILYKCYKMLYDAYKYHMVCQPRSRLAVICWEAAHPKMRKGSGGDEKSTNMAMVI